MASVKNVLNRFRQAMHRKNHQGRRASVLVIVVAILTLIALIGTAYIATARIDRYTAASYVSVNAIEGQRKTYVDEVTQMAKDAILSDVNRDVTSPRVQP